MCIRDRTKGSLKNLFYKRDAAFLDKDVYKRQEENEKIRFEDINLFAHSLSNALVDIALRGHQMTVTNAHLLANDLSTGCLLYTSCDS